MNYRPDPLTRIMARAARGIMTMPEPLLRLIARPPRNGRGYLLDADVAMSLALLKIIGSGKGIGELEAAEEPGIYGHYGLDYQVGANGERRLGRR